MKIRREGPSDLQKWILKEVYDFVCSAYPGRRLFSLLHPQNHPPSIESIMTFQLRAYQLITLFLASNSSFLNAVAFDQGKGYLRGSMEDPMVCRITMIDTLRELTDGAIEREKKLACIPVTNGVESDGMYEIDLPHHIFAQHKALIEEGRLLLSIRGAIITESNVDLSQATNYNKVDQTRSRRKLERAAGNRTIAVIRVSTNDARPKDSLNALKVGLFGNAINLRTQYQACSFNQLNWELSTAIEVKVNQPVSDFASGSALVSAAQQKIKSDLNIASVADLGDKVMFCLPAGTGSWVASAGVNHWRAQFNNDWCLSLTATMHEIGKLRTYQ